MKPAAKPLIPDDVVVTGPASYFAWLRARLAWGDDEARLRADAKAACEAATAPAAAAAKPRTGPQ